MKIVLLSKDVIWDDSQDRLYPGILQALQEVHDEGNRIFLVSNQVRPHFLKDYPIIEFCACSPARQKGKIVQQLSRVTGTDKRGDYIVFGVNETDFLMATNARILLLGAGWAKNTDERIKKYGLPFTKPSAIPHIVRLLSTQAPWYFKSESDKLDIYALTKSGTLDEKDPSTLRLIHVLRSCLKDGSQHGQKAFLLHLLSSVLATEAFQDVNYWETWPGSESENDRSDVMDVFAKHLRYTHKNTATSEPLFIRHTKAPRRHEVGGDRTDPASQLSTIHLSPVYKGKIAGKTFVILDDYLTYGLSFGVAANLLLREGAKKVICLAMGKFGNQAKHYKIPIIEKDVYKKISQFSRGTNTQMIGAWSEQATLEFVDKFKKIV